ncbi:MAG: DUF4173 domain-containing protein [Clostridia bacterium]|nr:DUF4173 domain-containing protein [Clostridia bacterium]
MTNILIGAVVFSIWFVTLFFEKSIGLSMLLYVLPLASYIIYILRKNKKEQNSNAKFLIIPIIILASTYFIYNNSFFKVTNILVILILIAIMILEILNRNVLVDFISLKKVFYVFFKPLYYLDEVFDKLTKYFKEKLKINTSNVNKGKTSQIIKAMCVTIPLILIILVLLSTADDAFGNIFVNIFEGIISFFKEFMFKSLIERILSTIGVFVYLICLFYSICSKNEKENGIKKIEIKDNFTIKMILACLNIIYLVFCTIQIKSLFLQSGDINYASYARKGFFQLMAVSIINLVTILVAKKSESIEDKKSNKYINSMSLIMVIFTFIILISATIRMYNYESAYGYTLLRLLVYCTLFTEGILLIPTSMFILDKKVKLVQTYFCIVLLVYIGMNFANFDNLIAKRNIDRYFETGKIDIDYLVQSTGTDAVEQIARILEESLDMSEETNYVYKNGNRRSQRYEKNFSVLEETKDYLKDTYTDLKYEKMDYRDFNLSKYFAKKELKKLKNEF